MARAFGGAIWGYVALNADKDTVYGVLFLATPVKSPGLGAEIATIAFQNEFRVAVQSLPKERCGHFASREKWYDYQFSTK